MSFCQKCGTQLVAEAQFCPSCGTPVVNQATQTQSVQQTAQTEQEQVNYQQPVQPQYQQPTYQYQQGAQPQYQQPAYQYQVPAPSQYPPVLENFTKKVKVEGIIWIVIASLQAIFALYCFSNGATLSSSYYFREQASQCYFYGVVLAIVAVINFIVASRDIKNSKLYLEKPVGIVKKYKPIGGYIINIIYNVLFGGLFGVVGSIYGFYVRSLVTNNEAEFLSYEQQYLSKQNN